MFGLCRLTFSQLHFSSSTSLSALLLLSDSQFALAEFSSHPSFFLPDTLACAVAILLFFSFAIMRLQYDHGNWIPPVNDLLDGCTALAFQGILQPVL